MSAPIHVSWTHRDIPRHNIVAAAWEQTGMVACPSYMRHTLMPAQNYAGMAGTSPSLGGTPDYHPSILCVLCVSVFVSMYVFCLFVCLVCLLVYTERIMPLGRAPLPGISFGILCLPVCGNIARRWCHRVEPLACHHRARPPQDASQASQVSQVSRAAKLKL